MDMLHALGGFFGATAAKDSAQTRHRGARTRVSSSLSKLMLQTVTGAIKKPLETDANGDDSPPQTPSAKDRVLSAGSVAGTVVHSSAVDMAAASDLKATAFPGNVAAGGADVQQLFSNTSGTPQETMMQNEQSFQKLELSVATLTYLLQEVETLKGAPVGSSFDQSAPQTPKAMPPLPDIGQIEAAIEQQLQESFGSAHDEDKDADLSGTSVTALMDQAQEALEEIKNAKLSNIPEYAAKASVVLGAFSALVAARRKTNVRQQELTLLQGQVQDLHKQILVIMYSS